MSKKLVVFAPGLVVSQDRSTPACVYLHSIGFKTTARYYALNILEELDSPNEVRVEFMTQCYVTILSMNVMQSLHVYSIMLTEDQELCISLDLPVKKR